MAALSCWLMTCAGSSTTNRILARPIGTLERLVRLCQRYPREARLVGICVGLIVLFAISATWAAFQFAAANELSQRRLKLYRESVSTSVNRLPQMIERYRYIRTTPRNSQAERRTNALDHIGRICHRGLAAMGSHGGGDGTGTHRVE